MSPTRATSLAGTIGSLAGPEASVYFAAPHEPKHMDR
jgi:hypothetical protein